MEWLDTICELTFQELLAFGFAFTFIYFCFFAFMWFIVNFLIKRVSKKKEIVSDNE